MKSPVEITLIILAMAGVTYLTRALPFFIFKKVSEHPIILFLGDYFPPAVLTLLVIYSLKSVEWAQSPYGLPELTCVALVAIVHLIFKNALISIASGTVIYMAIQQNWFG